MLYQNLSIKSLTKSESKSIVKRILFIRLLLSLQKLLSSVTYPSQKLTLKNQWQARSGEWHNNQCRLRSKIFQNWCKVLESLVIISKPKFQLRVEIFLIGIMVKFQRWSQMRKKRMTLSLNRKINMKIAFIQRWGTWMRTMLPWRRKIVAFHLIMNNLKKK